MKESLMKTALMALAITAMGTIGLGAHGGHSHVVMGTVLSIAENRIEIQTKDAKKTSVLLRDNTIIRRGNVKAASTDLKIGDRIVVDATQEKDVLVATTIRLAAAPQTASKSAKP
jgi:hypothetical protein